MIKYGLKLWSTNTDLIEKAENLVDKNQFVYIELTFVPNTEIKPFLNRDVEYIIHLPTNRHGVNIGDVDKVKKNVKIIQEGLEWANKLDAKYAILHPGYGKIKEIKSFLERIGDRRIVIENMPFYGLDYEDMVGYSKNEIAELKDEKFGFCFDLNHAIKAAISLNENYEEYIENLIELEPQMFHVADGKLDFERDEHLHIGEGEYNWDFLMGIIKNSYCEYVTLETPRDELEDDLKNLKKLKGYYKNIGKK